MNAGWPARLKKAEELLNGEGICVVGVPILDKVAATGDANLAAIHGKF